MRAAALLLALGLAGCGGIDLSPPGSDEPDGAAAAEGESAETDPGIAALPVPQIAGGDAAEGEAAEGEAGDGEAGAAASPATAGSPEKAAPAPHVYMTVQPDRGGPVSVVFAIDRSRDNTPSDEPAIRLTPEQTDPDSGSCNPQQLRYFNFPADADPVYGPDEAARGIGARDLPGFMATAVSQEMIQRGIAADLEATRPQNVCTRKLFEQTIIAANTGQG